MIISSTESIMDGALRLTNGITRYEGRVEMYWDSEWRTICSDGWDESDAKVVCRQMKYLPTTVQIHGILTPDSSRLILLDSIYSCTKTMCHCALPCMHLVALSYDDDHFKSRRNPMLLANVGCNGSEGNLTSCCSTVISNRLHCNGQTYAGVRCSRCIEHSIQLVGELSQQVGLPVICLNGRWERICDILSTAAAAVICRQLGFSTENPTLYHTYFGYRDYFYCHFISQSTGQIPYTVENVQCTANETKLSQCNYTQFSPLRECGSWSSVRCQTTRENVPGAPQALNVLRVGSVCNELPNSSLMLIWSPPLVSEIYDGLNITGYTINCSTGLSPQTWNNNITQYTDGLSVTFTDLLPLTFYNCCVAAVSNHGRGKLACINVVRALNGAPTRLQSIQINSTTILLGWNAPNAECVNGVPKKYHIEVVDNSTRVQMNYTTEHTYLLLNIQWRNHQYMFRVAVYTQERWGPFSQHTLITFNPKARYDVNSQPRTGDSVTPVASMLGLVSFILLVVSVAAGIYISYRVFKHDKKAARPAAQVPVYEEIDLSHQDNSKHYSEPETHLSEHRDVNAEQFTFNQRQLVDVSKSPLEYITPSITESDQMANSGQLATDRENTYQPLIPSRSATSGEDKSDYQSLLYVTPPTLTSKFNVNSPEPAPPAIPPKPKAPSTLTQGSLQRFEMYLAS